MTRGGAKNQLTGLLVVGLTLQVIGFVVAVLNFPHLVLTFEDVVVEGDRGVMMIGLLLFGLGGAMSLVAVVGFGVLLGMRARAEETSS